MINRKSEELYILDTKISSLTFNELLVLMKIALNGTEQTQISKSNGEFLIRAYKNKKFQKLLNGSDLNIPDGVGVLWSAKYLSLPVSNKKIFRFFQSIWQMLYSGAAVVFNTNYIKSVIPERLSGVEVFYTMLEACEQTNSGVFFFGARQEVLDRAIKIIKTRHSKLIISGYKNGYEDKGSEIISMINKSSAKLLIVALGSPEQEQWIADNIDKMPKIRVAVGEGGSFDIIAGSTIRAPRLLQQTGLEWLWRMFFARNLTSGASSRWRRVWNAVPVFIYEVVKWKVKNGAQSLEK